MDKKEQLDQLLQILLFPTYESNALYESLTKRNEKSHSPLILVISVVRLGVQAGFTKPLITTIINSMVEADGITESAEKLKTWVDGAYAEYKRSSDNAERRRNGLSPLS